VKEKNESSTFIYMNQAESRGTIVLWLKIAEICTYNWDNQNKIVETKLKWWWLDWWLDSLNCKIDSINWDYLKHQWFMF